ncbi:S9 family peptidase [Isoalcanivorax beigongshangi]|uniref:Prolyl oligopeptidase family serine peptidase n=1 Tax=Isoalcanivorax beigongshangi TaxID=3238810 RepID=A0ABV4AFU9_9GAMM
MSTTPNCFTAVERPPATELAELHGDAQRLVWLRCDADGQSSVWQWQGGQLQLLTSQQFSVRSRVYEYGGGAMALAGDSLVCVGEHDQQLYWLQPGQAPRPLTTDRRRRYGGLAWDAWRQRVLAVEEEAGWTHRLVAVDREGRRHVLHQGADFYASPAVSADGQQLAWVSWQRPHQPWTESRLCHWQLDAEGGLLQPLPGLAQTDSSVQQPCFDAQGRLGCLWDACGHWRLWVWQHSGWHGPLGSAADQTPAAWLLGRRHLAAAPSGGWFGVAKSPRGMTPHRFFDDTIQRLGSAEHGLLHAIAAAPGGCAVITHGHQQPARLLWLPDGGPAQVLDRVEDAVAVQRPRQPDELGGASTAASLIPSAAVMPQSPLLASDSLEHDVGLFSAAAADTSDLGRPAAGHGVDQAAAAWETVAPLQTQQASHPGSPMTEAEQQPVVAAQAIGVLATAAQGRGAEQSSARSHRPDQIGEERQVAPSMAGTPPIQARGLLPTAARGRSAEPSSACPRWSVQSGKEGQTSTPFIATPPMPEPVQAAGVPGWLYRPASGHGAALPAVVVLHGGPVSASHPVWSADTGFWTAQGWAVLAVNYCGSTGYGRGWRQALAGQWGEREVEDVLALTTALADRRVLDRQRLFLRGQSAGGYTLFNTLLRAPGLFRAAASRYGVADPLRLREQTHKLEADYIDWLIGDPVRVPERYVARSALARVDELRTPMIFFQGELDAIVPPAQTRDLEAALRRQGTLVAAHYYPDEGHGLRKRANQTHALQAEWQFYQQLLPRRSPCASSSTMA